MGNYAHPLAVLLTNIFNNQMPDEEDELDNLVFDVKKRAKIEEYNVEDFTSNYYYKNILPLLKKYQTKSEKFGNIYFSTDFYSAYNIFLSDEIYLDSHFKEITPLAYFSTILKLRFDILVPDRAVSFNSAANSSSSAL